MLNIYMYIYLEILNDLFDYFYYVDYYLTPSGCSVDYRVISLNGVGDLQDSGDCFS